MNSSSDIKPEVKPQLDVKPNVARPTQEPEEEMAIEPTFDDHNVWAMRIPRFLLEQWERVTEEGVELGTLVVDHSVQPPKVTLRLPQQTSEEPVAGPSTTFRPSRPMYNPEEVPEVYDVTVPGERAKNTFVFTEKRRTWGPMVQGVSDLGKIQKQKAHPKLVARVAHEAVARPRDSARYLKVLQQRQDDARHSRRPVVQMEATGMSRGMQNQLASGVANMHSQLGKGIVQHRVGAGERYARMERAELTDRLFAAFSSRPYWSIGALKQDVKQPDVWLREVLTDVGEQVREGPYNGLWKLKEAWLEDGPKGEGEDVDLDGSFKGEGSDDDDDDDIDLEEVMMS